MSETVRALQSTRAFAPRPVNGDRPFITVIVPVRNEAAFIAGTLRQLLTQEYDPARFEVLVADGDLDRRDPRHRRRAAAPPRQPQAARQPGAVVECGPKRRREGVARRRHRFGGRALRPRQPGATSPTSRMPSSSGADCVGRPQPLDVTDATHVQEAIAAARASRLGHHPASHIYSDGEGFVPPQSVAIAYRRTVFETVGLFDESFDACEDVELNHRVAKAELPCWFTPKVRVRYHPRGTLAGLCRQMFRYGRGRARLLRKHRDTFSVGGFMPAAFLLGLAFGPLVSWLLPPLWFVYGGVVGLYALAVLGTSAALALREPALFPLFPLVFLAVHFGAGAGVLWEAATGRKPTAETVYHPSAALKRKAG